MSGKTTQQPAREAAAAPAPGAAAAAPKSTDNAAPAKPTAQPPSRLGVLNGVAGFITFVGCIALHYVWELPQTPTIGSVQPQHSTWLTPITVEDKLRVVALSFFVCASMFALLPGTPELRSRIVSSVHGIFSTYLAYRALVELKGSSSWTDMMVPSWSDPIADKARYYYSIYPAVALCTAVTVGYIGYDSSLLLVDPKLLDWGMKIHHTVALLGFGSSLFTNFAMPVMVRGPGNRGVAWRVASCRCGGFAAADQLVCSRAFSSSYLGSHVLHPPCPLNSLLPSACRPWSSPTRPARTSSTTTSPGPR